MNKKSGFTLVELIIVVVVILTLIGLACHTILVDTYREKKYAAIIATNSGDELFIAPDQSYVLLEVKNGQLGDCKELQKRAVQFLAVWADSKHLRIRSFKVNAPEGKFNGYLVAIEATSQTAPAERLPSFTTATLEKLPKSGLQ